MESWNDVYIDTENDEFDKTSSFRLMKLWLLVVILLQSTLYQPMSTLVQNVGG